MEKVVEINSLIVSLFGVGLFGMGGALWKQMKARKEAEVRQRKMEREMQDQRFSNLEYASRSILHDKIYTRCEEYIKRGYIKIDELNNLDYLYRGYKALGGNSTGDVLMEKVKKLDIREEK